MNQIYGEVKVYEEVQGTVLYSNNNSIGGSTNPDYAEGSGQVNIKWVYPGGIVSRGWPNATGIKDDSYTNQDQETVISSINNILFPMISDLLRGGTIDELDYNGFISKYGIDVCIFIA